MKRWLVAQALCLKFPLVQVWNEISRTLTVISQMLFEAWSLVDSSSDELFLGSLEYLILGVGKGKGNSRGKLK